jgi:hypothetical protein
MRPETAQPTPAARWRRRMTEVYSSLREAQAIFTLGVTS